VAAVRRGKRGGRTLPQSLDQQVASYSLGGILTLVTAAGAAPLARHRWTSVAYLVALSLALAKHGSKAADPSALGRLMAGVRRDDRALRLLEDFLPGDPRLVVLQRRGDRLVRLFPGSVERPVADVERSDMVADAVDDYLVPRLGFGIRDYVDTGLLYLDHAIGLLCPAWPDGSDPADIEAPARVSDAEYAAAAALTLRPLPPTITDTARRAAALRFATSPAHTLPYEPGHPSSFFGHYFAVSLPAAAWPGLPQAEDGESLWWLPLAFIPDALGYGVTVLAEKAAGDPGCQRRFAQLAAGRARRAMWRFGSLLGPDDEESRPVVSPRNVVQWVCPFGEARAVLVQLVTGLSPDLLAFDEEPAAIRIAREARNGTGPIRVPMPGAVLEIDSRAEVIPLLVTVSTGAVAALQVPGAAAMSLDDLTWVAQTADADSDLFMFCRALAASDRPQMIGFETINVWEHWRRNGKTFFGGGIAPRLVQIELHAGSAEWKQGGQRSPLERALLAVGLPSAAAFDIVEQTGSGPFSVYSWGEPS
jgi:hypothetical protein